MSTPPNPPIHPPLQVPIPVNLIVTSTLILYIGCHRSLRLRDKTSVESSEVPVLCYAYGKCPCSWAMATTAVHTGNARCFACFASQSFEVKGTFKGLKGEGSLLEVLWNVDRRLANYSATGVFCRLRFCGLAESNALARHHPFQALFFSRVQTARRIHSDVPSRLLYFERVHILPGTQYSYKFEYQCNLYQLPATCQHKRPNCVQLE